MSFSAILKVQPSNNKVFLTTFICHIYEAFSNYHIFVTTHYYLLHGVNFRPFFITIVKTKYYIVYSESWLSIPSFTVKNCYLSLVINHKNHHSKTSQQGNCLYLMGNLFFEENCRSCRSITELKRLDYGYPNPSTNSKMIWINHWIML